jgi:hypothetical protein
VAWTALFAAVEETDGWSVETLEREESVDDLAYELSLDYGGVVVCFVIESEVAYVVAESDDDERAALVFNEQNALERGMGFLPTGRAGEAARELAAWTEKHTPKAVAFDDARRLLTTEYATAEQAVAELFELAGLPWPFDDPRG